ncbi:MAG TPA: HAMP domain-containing histidine kinase, partial [Bacteroidetes bacterium]|nr:HAMP domain-containing histidine kinase [Bacteroidota bacterium]
NTKLSIALKDLKQLDNTKTDFLHMVSHELRTPLNGIMGGMELLKTHSFSDEVMDYLSILDLSTRRLESFSYKALDITQLQTMGVSIMHLNRISLSAFVETFIREYEKVNNIQPGRLLFHSDTSKNLVEADNNYFRKVLEIIVENALQYSPEDKPVRIIVEEKDDNVVCTIKDQGSGFPGSMLESSMMAFSPGVEHQDQRTGLSLHLARMVMHYLNGELQLSNAPEGGAVVRLVLPKIVPEEEKEDK